MSSNPLALEYFVLCTHGAQHALARYAHCDPCPCLLRRKSYRPGHITWDDIKEEATTGKQYICSCPDREGRPVIVMRPRNENTKNAERQMKYLVYHLEMASRMADEAGEASGLCPLIRLCMWL